MCEKYQGWTNYPTWCVHLWLTNEEGSYNHFRDAARRFKDQDGGKWALADSIRESIEENCPLPDPQAAGGLYTDLLTWAIAAADYGEIAKAFMEED